MLRLLREEVGGQTQILIRGPLGLWPFPILNALIIVIQLIVSAKQSLPSEGKPKARTYNIVRDERGRIVSIEEIWVE
jgi:hypothetical protein